MLELQRRFADHLRNPERNPPPAGIEERRLAIYRRLFFNNLSNLFARNFPVIRKLHEDEPWRALIRKFMVEHRSSTPMFTEIGGEFVAFIAETDRARGLEWPWLAELAHWEYLETCVRLAEDEVVLADRSESLGPEALLNERIRLNPTLQMAHYQWPVHRIGPGHLPRQPDPVLLAVYRRANDRVAFMQINALTASLLEALNDHAAATLARTLDALAERIGQPRDTLQSAALSLIATLVEREVILGPR
jgi:hypothetical protein